MQKLSVYPNFIISGMRD